MSEWQTEFFVYLVIFLIGLMNEKIDIPQKNLISTNFM